MSEPEVAGHRIRGVLPIPEKPSFRRQAIAVTKQVVEIVALVAVIVTAWLLYLEIKMARKAYEQQVVIHKQSLTDTWIQRLREGAGNMAESQLFLMDPALTERDKITKILDDPKGIQRQVNDTLSCLEEIALLYNSDVLDKDRILRGPRGVIVSYWKAARPWIEFRRADNHRLYAELETMVAELQRASKV